MKENDILDIISKLRHGSFEMSRQQFRNALKRSIGACSQYADGCWNHFRDAPVHYICSRTDREQKLELIRVCMKLERRVKAQEKRFAGLNQLIKEK